MKKQLLSVFVFFAISLFTIAQTTVTIPWDSYAATTQYQLKDGAFLSSYTPALNDVVTVTIAGTSDYNISGFMVAIADVTQAAGWWKQMTEFATLGNVTAGTPFSFTADLVISTNSPVPSLVLQGNNAVLAGAGTEITLTCSNYSYSVFTPIPGAELLTDNGNGGKQAAFTLLPATPLVAVDDVVRVSMTATSDVNITEFQVILVDQSQDAASAWWTELSGWTDFTPASVTAGSSFTITADIPVTSAPVGTSVNNQNVVIVGKTTAGLIQLSIDSFTAEILAPSTTTDILMPWNSYGGGSPVISYQAKDANQTFISNYTPVINDIITITIEGVADEDIDNFAITIADVTPAASNWKQLSAFKTLGNVTSGIPFSFTTDLVITETSPVPSIVFDGKNATLAGADGTGTSILLSLDTYDVSAFSPIPGAIILTDGGSGAKQASVSNVLSTATALKVGDVVSVTLNGVSDVSATEFQIVIVDETSAASYWKELSGYADVTPANLTAGIAFTSTTEITITAAPNGTGAGSQNIILLAKTTDKYIQISPSNFTATIVLPTDFSALNAAITAANTTVNNAVVGTNVGQYPQSAVTTYTAAIASAQTVANDATATQAQVNAAVSTLASATTAFNASVITAGNANKSALIAAVSAANTQLNSAVVGSANGQYPQSAVNTYSAAVATAQAVVNDANATQATVDAAVTTLASATTTFNASVIVVDKSVLQINVTAANTLVGQAVVGTGNGQYPQSAVNTYTAAIASAQSVLNDANATQATVDAAVTTLASATTTFNASVIVVDKSVLQTNVTAANAALSAAVVGAANGQYPQSAVDAYTTAVATAQAVLNNTAASQATVDAAVTTLATASSTFAAAVISGVVDKSVLQSNITAADISLGLISIGTNPGDFPQAAVEAYIAAITAAQAVIDNTGADQATVDAAVTALAVATAALLDAQIDDPSGIEELTSDIVSIAAYSISGVFVVEVSTFEELPTGFYVLVITKTNGSTETLKVCK